MSKPLPEISVIVCCHNQGFIHKFVESVKKSIGVTYEIIIVSSDDALCEVGIPQCTVINGPAMPAAKRNMGSRIARGRYLAFFDDDVEIEADCLRQFWLNADLGMVFGKLYKADEVPRFDEAGGYLTSTGFIWSRAGQNDLDNGQFDKRETIFAGKSASCMIRADLFNWIGGFDEDFGILGEESDLAWRVWHNGMGVYFIPTARGIHYFNTKWKPAKDYYTSSRVHFNGCRNYITMLIKNLEAKNLWRILPLHIGIWVLAGSLMCVTGKFTQGINIFKGLWYVIRNLKYILEKRRKVQNRRVISDRDLWPLIFRRPPRAYYTQRFTRYWRTNLHG